MFKNDVGGMQNEPTSRMDPNHALVYQIRIKGHLGAGWEEWFGNLAISLEENGDTLMTGPLVDQAALHGLLKKVRDLGMQLISVNRVEPGPAGASTDNPSSR